MRALHFNALPTSTPLGSLTSTRSAFQRRTGVHLLVALLALQVLADERVVLRVGLVSALLPVVEEPALLLRRVEVAGHLQMQILKKNGKKCKHANL